LPSARQIRTRIRTAKNIQQITKAMKMVAAARLNKAQTRVKAARPYSEKMKEAMGSLSKAGGGAVTHPLLEPRPISATSNIGIIFVSADRGLCGSYSGNMLKKIAEVLKTYGPEHGPLLPENTRMILVGRKGQVFFRRRENPVTAEFTLNMTNTNFAEAREIAKVARELYVSGQVDAVYLVYTKFFSALVQKPMVVNLLPIIPETDGSELPEAAGNADFIFEPDPASLFASILPTYVDTLVYQALLEAVASEHGSRMTAMSSATDNAGKMISNLTLALNRARQAAITKEIAEIVGGADALK
jgi:F-type H+-transporting ATPase subunit gamma